MPGRYNTITGSYGKAYQGAYSKKPDPDNEVGLGHIDGFELRMWDGRLARWTTTDPYGQYHSPYLGMGNNPVSSVDPDGGLSIVGAAVIGGIAGGAAYLAKEAINGDDYQNDALTWIGLGAATGIALKAPIVAQVGNGIINGASGSAGGAKAIAENSKVSGGLNLYACEGCLPKAPSKQTIELDKYKGGYIYDERSFFQWIIKQSIKDEVEISALKIKDPNSGNEIYFVEPWHNNLKYLSYTYPHDPPKPYLANDVVGQYHTHLVKTEGSLIDAQLSWDNGIIVWAIWTNADLIKVNWTKEIKPTRPTNDNRWYGKFYKNALKD